MFLSEIQMSHKLKLDYSLKEICVQIIYSHTSNQNVTHNLFDIVQISHDHNT